MRRLEREWRSFEEAYEGLAEPALHQPGVVGEWSVKDIIAHVTVWEEEALKHLPAILQGRTPPRYSAAYGGIDAFNALTMGAKKKLSLAEVLRERASVHRRLLELIERTPDEHLDPKARFRRRLRLDTYGHYRRHTRAIQAWRARQPEK